jgi:RNA polymerase sigma-70 factor, ECF subfamily
VRPGQALALRAGAEWRRDAARNLHLPLVALKVAVPAIPNIGLMADRSIYTHRFSMRCLGDEQLVRYAAEDDPLAFAILYERHLGSALRLAMQICSRYVLAEEVVQEAFLSLWRNRRLYDRHRGSVRAWLLWMVRNRAIDVLRQSIPIDTLPYGDELLGEALPTSERTDLYASRGEERRRVLAALDHLPHEQSTVIALAYYGGYTQSEIASMLDTPIGTIKGRMRLGLRKMERSFLSTA